MVAYIDIYCKKCGRGVKMKVVNWVAECPVCKTIVYRKKDGTIYPGR